MLSPNTAPHMPIATRALARVVEHVADDRHRDRVEHRAADRLEHAERDQQPEASGRPRTAASRARTPPGRSGTPACARSGRRSIPTASAGWRAPACRRRSSTAGPTAMRAASRWIDGQRDVDDRRVEPDDQQAETADPEDHEPLAAGRGPLRRRSFAFIHRFRSYPGARGCHSYRDFPPAGASLDDQDPALATHEETRDRSALFVNGRPGAQQSGAGSSVVRSPVQASTPTRATTSAWRGSPR